MPTFIPSDIKIQSMHDGAGQHSLTIKDIHLPPLACNADDLTAPPVMSGLQVDVIQLQQWV